MAMQNVFDSNTRLRQATAQRERAAAFKALRLDRLRARPREVFTIDYHILACELLLIAIAAQRDRTLRETWLALGIPLRLCTWGERSSEYWQAPPEKYAEYGNFERVFGFAGDHYGRVHLFDDSNLASADNLVEFVISERDVLQTRLDRCTRNSTRVIYSGIASQSFAPPWALISQREKDRAVTNDLKQRVQVAFPDLQPNEFARLSDVHIQYLDQQLESLVDAPGAPAPASITVRQRAAAQRSEGHRVGPETLLCRDRDEGCTLWLKPGDPIALFNVLGDVVTWRDLVGRGLIILDPAERDPTIPYRYVHK